MCYISKDDAVLDTVRQRLRCTIILTSVLKRKCHLDSFRFGQWWKCRQKNNHFRLQYPHPVLLPLTLLNCLQLTSKLFGMWNGLLPCVSWRPHTWPPHPPWQGPPTSPSRNSRPGSQTWLCSWRQLSPVQRRYKEWIDPRGPAPPRHAAGFRNPGMVHHQVFLSRRWIGYIFYLWARSRTMGEDVT